MEKWHLYHPAFLIVNNVQAARGDRGLFPVHGSDGGGARDAAGGDRAHPRRHLRPLAQGQGRGLRQLPHWTLPANQVSCPQVIPSHGHWQMKCRATFSCEIFQKLLAVLPLIPFLGNSWYGIFIWKSTYARLTFHLVSYVSIPRDKKATRERLFW